MDWSDESVSQETEMIFEAEELESSEDPPMQEWSSLGSDTPEENEKKNLHAQGLYDPGSGNVCAKYLSMSDTSLFNHLHYNYPAVQDPGIQEALFSPEKPLIYPDDGQDLYIALCKEMGQCLVRSFLRNLLSEEIDLSYYYVDPKGIRAMAKALTYNEKVKVLNLTDNFLTDDACYHLGEMLIYNSALQELNMSRCRIKATGAQRLLKGIARNRTLKTLNLNRNELNDDGAEYVAKAIQEGFNIEELYLSYNNISARGANALAEAFETPTRLIKLDLSWNGLIAPEPTYSLLRKLGESDCLQEIDLSWNALSGDRIGTAIKILLKAPKLAHLNLNNNLLTGDAIKNCIKGITKAKQLMTLDLSYNSLAPSDALNVLKKIKLSSIQNLLMDNVQVTSDFIVALEDVKESKPNLVVNYGAVRGSFKRAGPDMRELVLKRADYLTKKSKKNPVDIPLMVLKLLKDKTELLPAKVFLKLIRESGARLDMCLMETMTSVFAVASTAKTKNVDLNIMADYIKRLWPERKLPPTPPPEPSLELTNKKLKKRKRKTKTKLKSR